MSNCHGCAFNDPEEQKNEIQIMAELTGSTIDEMVEFIEANGLVVKRPGRPKKNVAKEEPAAAAVAPESEEVVPDEIELPFPNTSFEEGIEVEFKEPEGIVFECSHEAMINVFELAIDGVKARKRKLIEEVNELIKKEEGLHALISKCETDECLLYDQINELYVASEVRFLEVHGDE